MAAEIMAVMGRLLWSWQNFAKVRHSDCRTRSIERFYGKKSMETLKIILPAGERKPCVCGATLCVNRTSSNGHLTEVWLCSRQCGARGFTYEGALRRKIRLDLLSWGDLRRNAHALIAAHSEEHDDDAIVQ
jgi:hypothetical protein